MNSISKIPFILVTGFLGSGKTTFIKNILDSCSREYRIGVIQNEYAGADIDTADLESTGEKFEILEINNGSVFCVCQLAGFIDSLAEFIEQYHPGMIILEATGLADPIGIAELVQHQKLADKIFLETIICIIDAQNYSKVGKMSNRLDRQIRVADYLIINKVDLAPEQELMIRQNLAELNPYAEIFSSSYCRIEAEGIIKPDKLPVAFLRSKDHREIDPYGRADIRTVVLKTTHPVSLLQLTRFISETEQVLIRMKGFVCLEKGKAVNIQSTFGHTEIHEADHYHGLTELIGIGYDITPAEFGRRFHEIRKSF